MTAEQRFRDKVAPANAVGCELWTAATAGRGYGNLNVGGKYVYAHRFAWSLAFGTIPEGLFVLHRCDVPACVNPAHLFLGTNADNVADMWAKGRGVRGSDRGNAKLSEAEAVEIFLASGTQRAIAARHGVCFQLVSAIKRRKKWAHATANLTNNQPKKEVQNGL